jgi:plastocyanin
LTVADSLVSATKPPANTVSLGADGKEGVTYLGMLPAKLAVAAGTTVTFVMPKGSTEAHTASFGPGDPADKTSYMGTIAATLETPVPDQRALYPSDPPGPVLAALSPSLHGNGFWNSGALDAVAASPLASSSSVKFSTPGTYAYLCFIHPVMKGTITVQ